MISKVGTKEFKGRIISKLKQIDETINEEKMKDISAGYAYNNFIGNRKVRNLFKGLPFDVKLKNIDVNGQKRGCSGFITNVDTGKVCYISTEIFFNEKSGSGLYGDEDKAILMRAAQNTKDYTGGRNQWLSVSEIVETAERLTK